VLQRRTREPANQRTSEPANQRTMTSNTPGPLTSIPTIPRSGNPPGASGLTNGDGAHERMSLALITQFQLSKIHTAKPGEINYSINPSGKALTQPIIKQAKTRFLEFIFGVDGPFCMYHKWINDPEGKLFRLLKNIVKIYHGKYVLGLEQHNTEDGIEFVAKLAHQVFVEMDKADKENKQKKDEKAAEEEEVKQAKKVAENQLGFLPSTLRGVDAPSALGGGSIDVSINDTWALSLLSGHTQSASRVSSSGSKIVNLLGEDSEDELAACAPNFNYPHGSAVKQRLPIENSNVKGAASAVAAARTPAGKTKGCLGGKDGASRIKPTPRHQDIGSLCTDLGSVIADQKKESNFFSEFLKNSMITRKVDSLKSRIREEKDEKRKAMCDVRDFSDFPGEVKKFRLNIEKHNENIEKYEKEVAKIEDGLQGKNLCSQFNADV